MRLDRPTSSLRVLLTVAAAACTAAVATAAAAKTVAPPAASFTIDGAQITSPVRPTIAGTLTCTKDAHFHLYAWLAQQDRGALAKGSIPAKLPPRPTRVLLERARAASTCTGGSQPWSLVLTGVGKRPAGVGTGAANVCVVLYASRSHLYTLAQGCKAIALP